MAPGHRGRIIAILTVGAVVLVMGTVGFIYRQEIITRYEFWRKFESLGMNPQGYPEYRHRQTVIIFVRLPGGTFWMGAQKEDPNGQNYDPDAENYDGPVHEVTLSPFLIGKYEVTQAQWMRVMGSNPSHFQGEDERPVECISWYDVQRFIVKTGFLLPTEAQWEYACRAWTSSPFCGNLNTSAWYEPNSGDTTHAVGQKIANFFGLYDMHGNVTEWCEDIHNARFYSSPESAGPDPLCISGSKYHVVRGGSWLNEAKVCRSGHHLYNVYKTRDDVGFRPCFLWPF